MNISKEADLQKDYRIKNELYKARNARDIDNKNTLLSTSNTNAAKVLTLYNEYLRPFYFTVNKLATFYYVFSGHINAYYKVA